MEIIDFHAHIYPEKIAHKAVKSVGDFYSIEMQADGTPDGLIDIGKQAGISRFVVHSVALTPANVCGINDFIALECSKHKEFIGFAAIHPDMEGIEAEIDRILGLGFKGVKVHPDVQQFNIDDPKMFKIFEIIEGRLPIIIHCGDYRYTFSHPKRLAAALDMFPKLTVIAAHFGGWSVFDLALEYLADRFCYLDVSSSMEFLGDKRSKELINIYGSERILFGSDFPMWSPKSELERFCGLGLPKEDCDRILLKNALKILGESE